MAMIRLSLIVRLVAGVCRLQDKNKSVRPLWRGSFKCILSWARKVSWLHSIWIAFRHSIWIFYFLISLIKWRFPFHGCIHFFYEKIAQLRDLCLKWPLHLYSICWVLNKPECSLELSLSDFLKYIRILIFFHFFYLQINKIARESLGREDKSNGKLCSLILSPMQPFLFHKIANFFIDLSIELWNGLVCYNSGALLFRQLIGSHHIKLMHAHPLTQYLHLIWWPSFRFPLISWFYCQASRFMCAVILRNTKSDSTLQEYWIVQCK